jgi:hypothetical protein
MRSPQGRPISHQSAAECPDEIDIYGMLVSRLIAGQFPQWAGLAVSEVRSACTDHAIWRLGGDFAVRLLRLARAAQTVATLVDQPVLDLNHAAELLGRTFRRMMGGGRSK